MGKEPKITPIEYAKAPDRKVACHLLREITEKPVSFTPRKIDRQLILYGAGNLGRMAKEYFDRLAIPFLFVVDADPDFHRQDPFWVGVDVIGIQNVPIELIENALLAICVATTSFSQVTAPLREQGWRDVVPFYDITEAYRDRHPLSNGWFANRLNSTDEEKISEVLSGWTDDVSRAHHLQFIAWRLLREETNFVDAPINTKNRFFISEVLTALTDYESFLDVGAHNGGVSFRFMQLVNEQFNEVIAIEPDRTNLGILRGNFLAIAHDCGSRLKILSTAVGEKRERRMFYEGLGYASQLSELGKSEVCVTTIDQMHISPTFIKLHLEGHELAALKGAQETVSRCRPIITATSYHNDMGLWELPKWLMAHLKNYRFLMRLHSWCGTGAVVYAIPEERKRT